MSGFHIPKWLDLLLTAGDKVHKAVHPSRWGEDKPCECGLLTRGDCGRKFGPGCVAPTHRCTICGALWRWMPESFGGAWNLRSVKAGPCCDNAAMGSQIVEIEP